MGPSIATQIILNSSLKDRFDLVHIDTRVNTSLNTMGKFSLMKIFKSISIWLNMFFKILTKRPSLVIIPISQSTSGYIKDFIFVLIAKITFRKTLVHLRGSNFRNWLNTTSSSIQSFVKWSLKMNNGVIVLGRNLKPLFSGIFSDTQIYVCPNGGNYNIPKLNKNSDKIKILYLANLQTSKGIEDVLLSILLLKENNVDGFELDVVGSWRSEEVEKSCKDLVNANQLPVVFHPPSKGNDKLNYLAIADIFVFTPREPEGHPWVIVEAMAAGLPIISTDQGAIVESVIDQENGFIVPVENPEAIADKLTLLINDKQLRNKMSTASKKRYINGFTEEKMVENLSSIFEKVIA